MSDSDIFDAPRDHLLAELQSLRRVFRQEEPEPAAPAPGLLDLNAIFDEEYGAAPPGSNAPAADALSDETLIEVLVDEFLPRLEAALRERLRRLDPALLRRWAEEADEREV